MKGFLVALTFGLLVIVAESAVIVGTTFESTDCTGLRDAKSRVTNGECYIPKGDSKYSQVSCDTTAVDSPGVMKVGCDSSCESCTGLVSFVGGQCAKYSDSPALSFIIDCSAAGAKAASLFLVAASAVIAFLFM